MVAYHSAKVELAKYKEDLIGLAQYEEKWNEHHPETSEYVATANTASKSLKLIDAACHDPVPSGSSLISTAHLKPKRDSAKVKRKDNLHT